MTVPTIRPIYGMAHGDIRIGLKPSSQDTTVEEIRAVWRIADEAGFDHCWTFDHFAGIVTDPVEGTLEGWTLLGAMAEATSRVRIGCMVTGNTYRHPAVLAKMAVTVDQLSGGRLEFGIGAGWAENEHRMLGIEFGTVGQRIDRLEEACRLIKRLWTDDRADFEGRYYTLVDAIANPKPVQKPHPPVWIGGSGERKTLRVVAEHADVWNAPSAAVDVGRLSAVLDRHCDDVGRDPKEIRRSVQFRVEEGVGTALEQAQAYVDLGVTDLVFYVRTGGAREAEELAALLPTLRELEPA